MSRGLLDAETLSEIAVPLPDIEQLQKDVLLLSPDMISAIFGHDSTVPVAAVCLQDATAVLAEARYALHEVFAHRIWYLEKSVKRNEEAATFFGRFYADDAALRLYSAWVHLTEAITLMLQIDRQKSKKYKQEKVEKYQTKKQAMLIEFLRQEEPKHPITQTVIELDNSPEWQNTMNYRNRWVHEQPPTIEGLGLVWRRRQRWKRIENKGKIQYVLGIGGGDKPEHSVDDLIGFVQPSLSKFACTLKVVLDYYVYLVNKANSVRAKCR